MRSASRARAMRLGLASTRCGSCRAVMAVVTRTLSPPISFERAPHSGSQARTLSAASAGSGIVNRNKMRIRLMAALEGMRAMCAEAVDVLQDQLAIGDRDARLVGGKLQAKAAELGRAPVHHDGIARRVISGHQQPEVRSARSEPVRDDGVVDRAVIEAVVAVSDAPARHELIDRLRVPARLAAGVGVAQRLRAIVVGQRAGLVTPEVLALQLEVRDRGVAVWRPLQHEIRDPETAA